MLTPSELDKIFAKRTNLTFYFIENTGYSIQTFFDRQEMYKFLQDCKYLDEQTKKYPTFKK